jgi:hypothetical protein
MPMTSSKIIDDLKSGRPSSIINPSTPTPTSQLRYPASSRRHKFESTSAKSLDISPIGNNGGAGLNQGSNNTMKITNEVIDRIKQRIISKPQNSALLDFEGATSTRKSFNDSRIQ